MSINGKKILLRFKRQWQVLQLLELLLYGFGVGFLVHAITLNSWLAIALGCAVATLFFILRKPWRLSLSSISRYLDAQSEAFEHSTGLLLVSEENLSGLEGLQRQKVENIVSKSIKNIRPRVPISVALTAFSLFATLASWGYTAGWANRFQNETELPHVRSVTFQPLDSSQIVAKPPVIESQKLTVRPPSYTKLGATHQTKMQVRALKGSRLFWNVRFDTAVDSLLWQSDDQSVVMTRSENGYDYSTILETSGFYQFRFVDTLGASYQSELYALEVFEDKPPTIEIRDLKAFTSFSSEENKLLNVKAAISDDYGIKDAFIVATVGSGDGESVKFREVRMAFDEVLSPRSTQENLSKQIDLNTLNMVPGDELYFYVGAVDTKSPRPNTSRSETFFAVIEDTLTDKFMVESAMGADLMPAYFRSQRQLIIDTEKLIADRKNLSKNDFQNTSNALGADQKALRLKYGQFMGDEDDSSIQGGSIAIGETPNGELTVADYTHDHDSENGADHVHEETESEEKPKNALEQYVHNHDDPEESTLFTQSLKSKLRQAMQHMWDAELQLRLNTPKKSLPFQYRALKLIQDIKNSSRVYVHRIGFDAPPIKEESRLTGDIKSVRPPPKQENGSEAVKYAAMRKSVERLEKIIQGGEPFDAESKTLFEAAGKELAALAIEEPGSHLPTLQGLRWLLDKQKTDIKQLEMVRNGLIEALPGAMPKAVHHRELSGKMNKLLLEELRGDD